MLLRGWVNNQPKNRCMGVRGSRRSEHAQNISKWRPTMSLATECAEKVGSEHEKLRRNDGTTDLRAIIILWSPFMFKPK